ncbi:MAG: L-glyceraldehyde 3-phosphate reductase [Bacteroidota bacterium]|nr:L-glyceraldehyde 3-phosphate reductase [Bacteroidota bacterium]MDP4273659.1 L-glyceraldehyde 3-phosphate reductase [Bacteroidota bacterium]
MNYTALTTRYDTMKYNRCGKSGLLLPALSLGLWHNFGFVDNIENERNILHKAFDLGITHFDLANNYGPPYGTAEESFGVIFSKDFKAYRDELLISTKAGYDMWPGPYGNWGSRKYLMSSLDQSLKRMKLDYVDIFYSHRPDPETPIEETMGALADIVHQGKALYVGISNYKPEQAKKAIEVLKEMGVHCLIHQARYSMFERWVEDGLLNELEKEGVGLIAFSPLAQGMLTSKYFNGIPENSRAGRGVGYLKPEQVTPEKVEKAKKLNEIARNRNQSLAEMAIAWLLKDKRLTSVLVGASSPKQLEDNVASLNNLDFTKDELKNIDNILA